MPPFLALFGCVVFVVLMIVFDPAREPKTSPSVWVAVIWLFILGSRNPSQWFDPLVLISAQNLQEGNAFDRLVFSALILLALGILISRRFSWIKFTTQNLALTALLSFALLSLLWSDFPFITLKHWLRDLGDYLVVLVLLSDPRPREAIETALRRLNYLLIPFSVLLVKYFLQYSRRYSPYSGLTEYVGASTSKNMLGVLCLVSGLFFCWDTVTRWPDRSKRRTKRILLVNAAFLAMTLWLLRLSQSKTSIICFVLGCLVILAAKSRPLARHPGFLKGLIPSAFLLYLILDFGFGMNGRLAQALGRDPTLSDRTKIWAILLGMHTNPIIGTGYESFWLGQRLDYFWTNSGLGRLNEAHNGYLEVYLELGMVGIFLLGGFLIATYRKIWRRTGQGSSVTVFAATLWMVLVFYNMSEAAFEGGLLYTIFLMGAISVPERARSRVASIAASSQSYAEVQPLTFSAK
jgi:O-antigen ligase